MASDGCRITVKGLTQPWGATEIDVYLHRESSENSDCWAYLTIPTVRVLIGLAKGSSYGEATSCLKTEIKVLSDLVPGGKTKFFMELGKFQRAMKVRFSLSEAKWPTKESIETALQSMERAIEDKVREKQPDWDLCITPDTGDVLPMKRKRKRGGVFKKRPVFNRPPRESGRSQSSRFAAIVAQEEEEDDGENFSSSSHSSEEEEEDDAAAAMVASLNNSPAREKWSEDLEDDDAGVHPMLSRKKPLWAREMFDMMHSIKDELLHTKRELKESQIQRAQLVAYQMSAGYEEDKEAMLRREVAELRPEIEREMRNELKRQIEDEVRTQVDDEMLGYRQQQQAAVDQEMVNYKRRRVDEVEQQIVREQIVSSVGHRQMNIQALVHEAVMMSTK